jgi:Transposase DDE domain
MMKFSKYLTVLKEKLYNSIGFPFSDVINDDIIQQALNDEKIEYRERLYTPMVILWAWIYQCLSEKNTCKNAVSKIISFIAQCGGKTPSPNTGAYCKARKRIKEGVLLRLLRHTGKHLHNLDDLTWCGRRVVVADGSTITMDDTEDNQKEYPQPQSQKEGCGFPMANIVVLFCLKTGAVLEAIIGSLSIGELNLFRRLYEYLQPGDIALADRLYSSYADICLLKAGSVDGVFRLHARRKTDFQKGKILGVKDHIVTWSKPRCCPSGLEKSLFDKLPRSIQLRDIQYQVEIKGFRTQFALNR